MNAMKCLCFGVIVVSVMIFVFVFYQVSRAEEVQSRSPEFAPEFNGPLQHALEQLDSLTDEQKEEIDTILYATGDEVAKLMESHRQAMYNVQQTMDAAEFNEEAIRSACKQAESIMEDLMVLRARIFFEIKKILTEEQVESLKGILEQGKKMDQGRHGFGPPPPKF